ncbi:MAG: methyl-accepting chemotaxis protein [Terracidiphilus sp.]
MAPEHPVTNIETSVPENVFIYSRTDLKGRIVIANEAFASLSGYAVDEMVGKPDNLVRHPDMPKEAFADMWRSLKAGRPWQGAVKNRRKDGGFYWVLANVSPVREEGRVVGYQSLRRRPTPEQKRAAGEAYRRILQGDQSHQVHEGRVVHTRSRWAERAARPGFQLSLTSSFALLAVLAALSASLAATALPAVRIAALTVFGISGLAALFVLLRTLPALRRDLTAMEAYIDGILSTGDLTIPFDLEQQDSSGNIARKLRLLLTWIQSTFQSIGDTVIPVESGTQHVLTAIQEIDRAAVSQNMASASVSAAATQLDLTIREVSQHLKTTESAVTATGQHASDGAAVSQRAAEQIQNLESVIKEAAIEVEALSASSAEVGAIAGVIREIADQTNLLALNASIEAARAGESGRGFAVVAGEVRNLADRTMKATAKIEALLDTIKGDSARAIAGMRSGAAQVSNGVSLVQQAQQALSGIDSLMSDAVRKVTEITTASSQQTEAMNEISANIAQVAAMTEQNVTVVHQATSIIGELAPMVDRVKKAVAQYRA